MTEPNPGQYMRLIADSRLAWANADHSRGRNGEATWWAECAARWVLMAYDWERANGS